MELEKLQKRQLALLAIMTKSDAHSSKCYKMGISFKDTYPTEYEEYGKANAEYNENEKKISVLKEKMKKELEAEIELERMRKE